ncbi:hypothetical protein J6590_017228 [Homalodisca vitripennis]|nr:hypothetical protein J6590_017228 [Homalodisca vitripennis]
MNTVIRFCIAREDIRTKSDMKCLSVKLDISSRPIVDFWREKFQRRNSLLLEKITACRITVVGLEGVVQWPWLETPAVHPSLQKCPSVCLSAVSSSFTADTVQFLPRRAVATASHQ